MDFLLDVIVLCGLVIGLLRSFRSGRRLMPALVLGLNLAMMFTPLPNLFGFLAFAVMPLSVAALWIQIQYDSALAEARATNPPKWPD